MGMNFGSFASRVVATKVVATDGTGDFTDIQSAIDDLPTGGGVVYIKEGTYTITAKIEIKQDNTSLIGAGRATQIKTTSGIHLIEDSSHKGLFISQLRLTGSGSAVAGQDGIVFLSTTDSTISNCWIDDIGVDGIAFQSSSDNDNVITGNHIENCIAFGILLDGKRNIVSDNVIRNNEDGGIEISGSGTTNIITGNVITGNTDDGIRNSAIGSIISNNFVASNVRDGIRLEAGASQCIISNNIVIDNDSGDTATFSGISIKALADDNIIIGNRADGNDEYQIEVAGDNCIITNNRTDATGAVGGINNTGTGNTVANNINT